MANEQESLLRFAIFKAREVVESYKVNHVLSHPVRVLPNKIFLSTEPTPICEDSILYEISRLNNDIKLIWYPYLGVQPKVLRAAYLNYGDSAYAVIHESENRCWTRFLLCKEFMQVMLSNGQNVTVGAPATKELITNLLLNSPSSLNGDAQVDDAARFAAMELMLPKEHSMTYREYRDSGLSNKEIALSFLVPEEVVAERFSTQVDAFFESCYKVSCS